MWSSLSVSVWSIPEVVSNKFIKFLYTLVVCDKTVLKESPLLFTICAVSPLVSAGSSYCEFIYDLCGPASHCEDNSFVPVELIDLLCVILLCILVSTWPLLHWILLGGSGHCPVWEEDQFCSLSELAVSLKHSLLVVPNLKLGVTMPPPPPPPPPP